MEEKFLMQEERKADMRLSNFKSFSKFYISNLIVLYKTDIISNDASLFIRITKKVGQAVVRNKLKRRLRSLFRMNIQSGVYLISVKEDIDYIQLEKKFLEYLA